MHGWSDDIRAKTSNEKADIYQKTITDAIEHIFPLKTIRRKSTDLPWINNTIRKRIRRRMKIYRKEGRSELWKWMKKCTDDMIRERRDKYMNNQTEHLLAPDAQRSFFRNVEAFSAADKPQKFDVRQLRPENTEKETAEELALFFNQISAEFEPLTPGQIPITRACEIPELMPHEVASRIRHFRKPKSMVTGNIFPHLLTRHSNFLAIPLCSIYLIDLYLAASMED